MTTLLNLGDGSQNPGSDTMTLAVAPGATVTVAVTGSTVSYWSTGDPNNDPADGTITTGNNQQFTASAFLQSSAGGHSSLSITGGGY